MATAMFDCPHCRDRVPLRFGTDGNGRLVETRDPCSCETRAAAAIKTKAVSPPGEDDFTYEERVRIARKTGVCVDCTSPVDGKKGFALRCAVHKREARLRYYREYRNRNLEEAREQSRAYYRAMPPEKRAERKARELERQRERMASDPEYAQQYRLKRQREHLLSYPGREKYLATQRRHNADPARRERKRRLALEAYYRKHPVRPKPVCATCSQPIPWEAGKGCPPKYCPTRECNPHFASLRYQRRKRD